MAKLLDSKSECNKQNNDFEIYLEKFARDYNLTREEALQFKIVQYVKEFYESREGGNICEH